MHGPCLNSFPCRPKGTHEQLAKQLLVVLGSFARAAQISSTRTSRLISPRPLFLRKPLNSPHVHGHYLTGINARPASHPATRTDLTSTAGKLPQKTPVWQAPIRSERCLIGVKGPWRNGSVPARCHSMAALEGGHGFEFHRCLSVFVLKALSRL